MEADPPGLPIDRFLQWAATNLPGFDVSSRPRVELLAGGRSNLTYRLEDGQGREWALRRPPLGHVMPTAHDVAREYRVMSGLGKVGFPVPAMQGLCTSEEVAGAPFVVMDFVQGRTIATAADAHALGGTERNNASATLVTALVDLHQVSLQEAGLQDLARPEGYLQRQVHRWAGQWQRTKTRDLNSMTNLFDWLSAKCSAFDRYNPTLVHGDLRLDNIIMDDNYSMAKAVVDWEMSTIGHPVADLAVTLVYWSDPDDSLRLSLPVSKGVTSEDGFWTRSDILDAYSHHQPIEEEALDFCAALACAKLAVIMESIHYRQQSGQQLGTSATNREDMGLATEALGEMGILVTEVGTLKGLGS